MKCSSGNPCGASCIAKSKKCRVEFKREASKNIRQVARAINSRDIKNVVGQLFGNQPKAGPPEPARIVLPPLPKQKLKPQDNLVLDDVSRMLKGQDPLFIPESKGANQGPGEITRLQKALGLGELTREEVGRDWQVLRDEALRRKEELRQEIKKQRILGTKKAKAKEKELQKELDELNQAINPGQGQTAKVSAETKNSRLTAKYFDEGFSPSRSVEGKQSDFDWENNARRGTDGKSGGFGSVLFQGEVVVKRGELGEKELEILRKVGASDIGPELIFGELGKRKGSFASVDVFEGRVAMTTVSGSEVNRFSQHTDTIGNTTVGDAYWSARASLHRIGIAHNDAHGDNIIIDKYGKPRFVDFGLAQDDPKAALSEALGAVVSKQTLPMGSVITGGMRRDTQAYLAKPSGISEPPAERPRNLQTIYTNLGKVKSYMRSLGMSNDEIAQIMASGIRNPLSFYNKGAWGKLTNADSLKIINLLYDGI